MRSLLYSRVSTTDKGQDLERQFREMREFAHVRGWSTFELSDQLSASRDRPGLRELWKLCRARKVDVVLVHEFSRFSRSLKELVLALEEFKILGIQFVSMKQQIDTTTPMGQFMYHTVAAFAEFERSMISERVKSGMAHARAKGKRLGRPQTVVDPSIVIARRIEGVSWRRIARELGISPVTVRKAGMALIKEEG
jgi:DNA invertase Pin-like site-specific DNA recombinase